MKTISLVKLTLVVFLANFCDIPQASAEQSCKGYYEKDRIIFEDLALMEISGMALCHSNPDYIWSHVDSDGPSYLFLLNHQGEIIHTYSIKDTHNTDWEDIAVAPCYKDSPKMCIYIADIGDNHANRDDKNILIIEEPDLSTADAVANAPDELSIYDYQAISFPENDHYANSDAESFMVHPQSGAMYLVSKNTVGGDQILYYIPRQLGVTTELKPLASYRFTSGLGSISAVYNAVTGADFSPDGQRFLVRTYSTIYEYDLTQWPDMAAAFLHPTELFLSSEIQGEAVTYDKDGKSVITGGESFEYLSVPGTMSHFICRTDNVDMNNQEQFEAGTEEKEIIPENRATSDGNGQSDKEPATGCAAAPFSVDGLMALFGYLILTVRTLIFSNAKKG